MLAEVGHGSLETLGGVQLDNFNITRMNSRDGLPSTNGTRDKQQAHRLFRSY